MSQHARHRLTLALFLLIVLTGVRACSASSGAFSDEAGDEAGYSGLVVKGAEDDGDALSGRLNANLTLSEQTNDNDTADEPVPTLPELAQRLLDDAKLALPNAVQQLDPAPKYQYGELK